MSSNTGPERGGGLIRVLCDAANFLEPLARLFFDQSTFESRQARGNNRPAAIGAAADIEHT